VTALPCRVVFLDFDGVLNHEAFYRAKGPGVLGLDPTRVALVNEIVARTGAHVVVSSTWRMGTTLSSLRDTLGSVGFTGRVIGKTPDLSAQWKEGSLVMAAKERGDEIQAWIDGFRRHPVASFVILDDDGDMAHLKHRLVRTTFAEGLTREHVERAVEMLGKRPGRVRMGP
jgi:HAD domain in Swiss Army Knife RNA repair proteins